MTAQYSDTVVYQGEEFDVGGVNGSGLFEPKDHGVEPASMCTACWRGCVCHYLVDGQRLTLNRLGLWLAGEQALQADQGVGPKLFGQVPRCTSEQFGTYLYADMHGPVAFTGGLLLVRGFIEDLYVHMGFHPAWKFKEVHELIFRDGLLLSGKDRSAEMDQLREGMGSRPVRHDSMTSMADDIEKAFSLQYRW